MKRIFVIDIDGTICNQVSFGNYELASPYQGRIDRINQLYDLGNRIVFFTARGTTTGTDWRPLTEAQLKEWGVRYHELKFGKPEADCYIDDRAMSVQDFFNQDMAYL